jgi:hypothetical protein
VSRLVDLQLDAVCGAAGSAEMTFDGPGDSFDQLRVDAIACRCLEAGVPGTDGTVTLYRGRAADGRMIAQMLDTNGTFRGGGVADVIGAGDRWTVAFTRCVAGALVTASLTGTVERRGRPGRDPR